jgi:hypothetical protein
MLGYLERPKEHGIDGKKRKKSEGDGKIKYGLLNLDLCKDQARKAYDHFTKVGTGYPVRKTMSDIEFRLLDHEAKDPCLLYRDIMEKACFFYGENDIGK